MLLRRAQHKLLQVRENRNPAARDYNKTPPASRDISSIEKSRMFFIILRTTNRQRTATHLRWASNRVMTESRSLSRGSQAHGNDVQTILRVDEDAYQTTRCSSLLSRAEAQILNRHNVCSPNPGDEVMHPKMLLQLGSRALHTRPLRRFLSADRLTFESFIV